MAKKKSHQKPRYYHHVPATRLTDLDYQRAAETLGVEVDAIKAVAAVESLGSGFGGDGRPKILFEAAVFSRLTGGEYDKSHPNISSPTWNKSLYLGGTREYRRLGEAMKLDADAALQSASWGKFQIMGENYAMLGFESAESFVHAMCASEQHQLRAFVLFIQAKGLTGPLRRKDWVAFARGYNGKGFRKNHYHTHMKHAYEKLHKSESESAAMTIKNGNSPTQSHALKKDDYVIHPSRK